MEKNIMWCDILLSYLLMGRLEHEQIYLSLSRKELQGLCKQHGLPANRSNIDLARSLESLFRRTNFSSSPVDDPDVPSLSDVKPKDQVKSPREIDTDFKREYVERKNSSMAGAYKKIACLKEGRSKHKRGWLTSSHLVNESLVKGQTSDEGLDRVNEVYTCPPITGTNQDFGCSLSENDISCLKLQCASNIEDIMGTSRCPETSHPTRSGKLSEPNPSRDNLLNPAAVGSGMHSLSPVPCQTENIGECLPGRISSNAVTGMELPAFQFFVASEDGVSLFVDLGSTPSDWIKSLKNEICMPETLSHEIRYLGNAEKRLNKPSTEFVVTNSHLKGSDGSSGCGNSPLSSVASEFCNSAAHPIDDDTPKSSVLTSSQSPAELSSQLNEESRLVSSSCDAAKNVVVHDTQSCSREMETLQTTYSGNSLCLEKGNVSPRDYSVSKFSCNLQVDLDEERLQKLDQLDHQILEAASVSSHNVEEGFLCHVSESASEKSSFSLSSERCEVSRSFGYCNHENRSKHNHLSLATCSGGIEPLNLTYHIADKLCTSQVHLKKDLTCSANNTELDDRELPNHILDQQLSYHVNPVLEMPSSTVNEELETQIILNEKESSECPQSNKLFVKTCKRIHSSEIQEDRCKRPHRNAENEDATAVNFRSTKTYLKDSSSSMLVPRRSTRLMSKEI